MNDFADIGMLRKMDRVLLHFCNPPDEIRVMANDFRPTLQQANAASGQVIN